MNPTLTLPLLTARILLSTEHTLLSHLTHETLSLDEHILHYPSSPAQRALHAANREILFAAAERWEGEAGRVG
ncbi:hypothetical protein LTR28_000078, partial [Elasticomyces elasticus]